VLRTATLTLLMCGIEYFALFSSVLKINGFSVYNGLFVKSQGAAEAVKQLTFIHISH